MLSQIGRQACVFTFGYGPEHDTVLLPSLANAGNGLFYYIDNSDTIPESFCDCLGGLLSVAAQVRGRGCSVRGEGLLRRGTRKSLYYVATCRIVLNGRCTSSYRWAGTLKMPHN